MTRLRSCYSFSSHHWPDQLDQFELYTLSLPPGALLLSPTPPMLILCGLTSPGPPALKQ